MYHFGIKKRGRPGRQVFLAFKHGRSSLPSTRFLKGILVIEPTVFSQMLLVENIGLSNHIRI